MQFLVIARVVAGVPSERILSLVRAEAAKVWEFYAADRLRSIYYFADLSGAVLTYEAAELSEVEAAVAQLPMGMAGVLSFEIIPLKPYVGIAQLFAEGT